MWDLQRLTKVAMRVSFKYMSLPKEARVTFLASLTPSLQVSTLEETEAACSVVGEEMGMLGWGRLGESGEENRETSWTLQTLGFRYVVVEGKKL